MPKFIKRILFSRFLENDETLYYTIHRHWVTIYQHMIKIALVGIAPPLFFLIAIVGPMGDAAPFFFAWLLLGTLYSIYAFFDWYMDAWLLTDVSVIEVHWDGFFDQRSTRIDYWSIESIDYRVAGLRQSLLGYGTLILIRSSGNNVVIDHVNAPEAAGHWVGRIKADYSSSRSSQNSESIKSLLAEVISERININS